MELKRTKKLVLCEEHSQKSINEHKSERKCFLQANVHWSLFIVSLLYNIIKMTRNCNLFLNEWIRLPNVVGYIIHPSSGDEWWAGHCHRAPHTSPPCTGHLLYGIASWHCLLRTGQCPFSATKHLPHANWHRQSRHRAPTFRSNLGARFRPLSPVLGPWFHHIDRRCRD